MDEPNSVKQPEESTGLTLIALDSKKEWLVGVSRRPSPNCDERPNATEVNLLVIHGICLPPGQFGGPWIDDLFTNSLDPGAHSYFGEIAHLRVSTHLLIRRDGEIVQYVSFRQRAWHAGQSEFEGRSACNDFSIGIELEGSDDVPYTGSQYTQLALVCTTLMCAWPTISSQRIVGHCQIAPGRKTDPGEAFCWERLQTMLARLRSGIT